jgi:transcriptional regulator with PAS, ATPase and Fis domain
MGLACGGREDSRQDADAADSLTACTDDPFTAVLGMSPAIVQVVERLRRAAPLEVHVLLTGPSGVGKTLLAHAMHMASARRAARFVEVRCTMIPQSLLEGDLFGIDLSGHSAALGGSTEGNVTVAEGGTLFLDEVSALTMAAQAKLLQLLQDNTYCRLGGTQVRQANVRVVAATNVNLHAAVIENRFREDLYDRLRVLETSVPRLTERAEDLLLLSLHFLAQASERHQLLRMPLSPRALQAIQLASWPGNVRELANRMESAAIQAHLRGTGWIEDTDIFPDEPSRRDHGMESLQDATRRFQRKHVLGVLTATDWNVAETARVLEISRSHLYNLIRTFELKRE